MPLMTFLGDYTTKCDIYSLGIALYSSLMCGYKPLGANENVLEIKHKVHNGSVLNDARWRLENRQLRLADGCFSAVASPVDAATCELVLSMLVIDPAARLSAAALLASSYFDGVREEAQRLFGPEGCCAADGTAEGSAAVKVVALTAACGEVVVVAASSARAEL